MSSWNFDISLLIWQEQIQKLFFFFFLMVAADFWWGVFILYNFSYLHLGSIFFKCIIFVPTSFSFYN